MNENEARYLLKYRDLAEQKALRKMENVAAVFCGFACFG